MEDSYKSPETQLAEATLDDQSSQTRQLIIRIWQLSVNSPRDETWHLLPGVLKLMASNDLLVKKLACWFLSQHSNDENTVLLAINTLLKDCKDPNPMVRGLALRTVTRLPHKHLLQYSLPAVTQGLRDSSAYVRRIAISAVPILHKLSPSDVLDGELLDHVYSMIRDSDPIVTVNCLSVLDVILAAEGGIVINKNIALHLLGRLNSFTEWGLVTVFKLLCKYRPKNDEQISEIMNKADEYLRHSNTAVAHQAFQYFLHLIINMPHLQSQINMRTMETLLTKLNSGNHELTYAVLNITGNVLPTCSELFKQKFKLFFCKYNEPAYLKQRRLVLLPSLVEKDNKALILEELELYCQDGVPDLCHKALEGLGELSKLNAETYQSCMGILVKLLQHDSAHVVLGVLQVLQGIELGSTDQDETIFQLLSQINTKLSYSNDKTPLLWLLGEHSDRIPHSPYVLEELVAECEYFTPNAYISCLTAAVKVFLMFPAQTQVTLSEIMEKSVNHSDNHVRDKAWFYYHVLKGGPGIINAIVT